MRPGDERGIIGKERQMIDVLRKSGLAGAALLSLGARGGRVAQPVLVEQSFDALLSCAHLAGEFDNNEKRLAELKVERDGKAAYNLGILVTSPALPRHVSVSEAGSRSARPSGDKSGSSDGLEFSWSRRDAKNR
jgi:hypothetical protein